MTIRIVAALIVVFPFALFAADDGPANSLREKAPVADKQAAYDAQVELVKKSDSQADFLKLRMAYTETANYNPYGDLLKSQPISKALQDKDYEKAAELGEAALKTNFVDVRVHSLLRRAYTELKQEEKAKFHAAMFDGLVESIKKSGDGQSPATAMAVISTDEEYAVLAKMGLRRTSQSLMENGGRRYDMLECVGEHDMRQLRLYFDVTIPFDWMGAKLLRDIEKSATEKPAEPGPN